MSRHRNVRTMDYNDEYDGYDDVYGHSVDDDSYISPSDAQQWLYDRARGQQSMSSYIATHRDIEEEDEDFDEANKKRRDSEDFRMPILNDEDQVRLVSCMEEIRNVVGESVSDKHLVETILKHQFDFTKSLDDVLNDASSSSRPSKLSIDKEIASKESIEKDLNPNSLADLLKQRGGGGGGAGESQFILPNKKLIFNSKPSSDPTFNKLADLANFHVKNQSPSSSPTSSAQSVGITAKLSQLTLTNNSSTFIIPKLATNVQKLEKTSLTPLEISLQKIKDSKRNSLTNESPPSVGILSLQRPAGTPLQIPNLIDLTTALRVSKDSPILEPVKSASNEIFRTKFIDCEDNMMENPVISMPTITQDCEIDISNVLRANYSNRTNKVSRFGKILCATYRAKLRCVVKHDFKPKNLISAYQFGKPSPDDIVLRQIRLLKNN